MLKRWTEILTVLGLLAVLAGCHTADVADTKNPEALLHAAYASMHAQESATAKHQLVEAEGIYAQKGDDFGLAETHVAWGLYYKDTHLKPPEVDLTRSAEHFRLALGLYQKHHWNFGAAKTSFNLGEATIGTDKPAACAAWQQSIALYTAAQQGTEPPDKAFHMRNGKDFPALVRNFRKHFGCPGAE